MRHRFETNPAARTDSHIHVASVRIADLCTLAKQLRQDGEDTSAIDGIIDRCLETFEELLRAKGELQRAAARNGHAEDDERGAASRRDPEKP